MTKFLTILCFAVVVALQPASAAGRKVAPPDVVYMEPSAEPYSPLQSQQARSVAASRDCFRSCQLQCSGTFQACIGERPVRNCLPKTDSCDRSCQRQCRFTWDFLLDFFE